MAFYPVEPQVSISSPFDITRFDQLLGINVNEQTTHAFRYIIVDVYDHYFDNKAVISEIQIIGTNGQPISYSTVNNYRYAYDSARDNKPRYWDKHEWNRSNLSDSNTALDKHNLTALLYSSYANDGQWCRFRLKFNSVQEIAKIKVVVPGKTYSPPKKITFYGTNNWDYHQVVYRCNDNLSYLGEVCPDESDEAGNEAVDHDIILASGNQRYALSFDNGNTWHVCKNGTWSQVTLDGLIVTDSDGHIIVSQSEGMTQDELVAITSSQFNQMFSTYGKNAILVAVAQHSSPVSSYYFGFDCRVSPSRFTYEDESAISVTSSGACLAGSHTQSYMITTDDTQLDVRYVSNWNSRSLSIVQNSPNSEVRGLVSFDRRNTWYYYDGTNWVEASGSTIRDKLDNTNCLLITIVDAIKNNNLPPNGTWTYLDFVIDLYRANSSTDTPKFKYLKLNGSTTKGVSTPILRSINYNVAASGFWKVRDSSDVDFKILHRHDSNLIYVVNESSHDRTVKVIITYSVPVQNQEA